MKDRITEAERLLSHGKIAAAENAAGEVLLDHPQVPRALVVLGRIAAARGQGEQAMTLWDMATRLGPSLPQPWVEMGQAFWALGKPDRTIACLEEALKRQANLPDVWINLGIALGRLERHAEAIKALERGLGIKPRGQGTGHRLEAGATPSTGHRLEAGATPSTGHRLEAGATTGSSSPAITEAQVALATSLHALGKSQEAIEVLRGAAQRDPRNAKVLGNLGVLYEKTDRLDDAIAAYDQAAAITPDDPKLLFNRGSSLIQQLKIAEARRDWDKATRLAPDYAEAQMNLAILELLDGNLARGFELFEWRWQVRHRRFPIPCTEWDGSPLDGRHLLLFMEQGLGDMLQFCRYVPILSGKYDVRITLCALPTLHRLLATLSGGGVERVIGIEPPYPPADGQCSVMSLPRLLGTTLDTIPGEVGYLSAEPDDVARWQQRLERLGPGRKVGLYWKGTLVDENRIIPLKALRPLWTQSPGAADGPVRFVSLQIGPGQEEVAGFDLPLEDLGSEIKDFADTAAILMNLDLLITIDTAIAHAAGALARPTWTLLPYRPDWRWLLGREDSPWYPTMRLYRQTQRKNWESVIARVANDLRAWIEL